MRKGAGGPRLSFANVCHALAIKAEVWAGVLFVAAVAASRNRHLPSNCCVAPAMNAVLVTK